MFDESFFRLGGIIRIDLADLNLLFHPTPAIDFDSGNYIAGRIKAGEDGPDFKIKGDPFDLRKDSIFNVEQTDDKTVTAFSEFPQDRNNVRGLHAHQTLFAILPLANQLCESDESIKEMSSFKWSAITEKNLNITASLTPIPVNSNGEQSVIRGTFVTDKGRKIFIKAYSNGEDFRCESDENPLEDVLFQDSLYTCEDPNLHMVETEVSPECLKYLQEGGPGLLASTAMALLVNPVRFIKHENINPIYSNILLVTCVKNFTIPTAEQLASGMRIVLTLEDPDFSVVAKSKVGKVVIKYELEDLNGEQIGCAELEWAGLPPDTTKAEKKRVLEGIYSNQQQS